MRQATTPELKINEYGRIATKDGTLLSLDDKKRIVRAVNLYDELVEEVKRYRSIASDTERFSEAKRRELDDLIKRAEGRK